MPKQYSEMERVKFCESWKTSNQSKIRFCKESGISKSTLYKWLSKFVDQVPTKESSIKFLPIEVSNTKTRSHMVEITLPNGVMLSTEVASLSMLVKELLR